MITPSGAEQRRARRSHKPENVGSSPTPATNQPIDRLRSLGAVRFRRRTRRIDGCDQSCPDSPNGAPKRRRQRRSRSRRLNLIRLAERHCDQQWHAGPDRCSPAPEAAVDSGEGSADSRQRPLTPEKDPAAGSRWRSARPGDAAAASRRLGNGRSSPDSCSVDEGSTPSSSTDPSPGSSSPMAERQASILEVAGSSPACRSHPYGPSFGSQGPRRRIPPSAPPDPRGGRSSAEERQAVSLEARVRLPSATPPTHTPSAQYRLSRSARPKPRARIPAWDRDTGRGRHSTIDATR